MIGIIFDCLDLKNQRTMLFVCTKLARAITKHKKPKLAYLILYNFYKAYFYSLQPSPIFRTELFESKPKEVAPENSFKTTFIGGDKAIIHEVGKKDTLQGLALRY